MSEQVSTPLSPSANAPTPASHGPATRVLVTGAAGFIGATYVRMLLDDMRAGGPQVDITVLDKLTYAADPSGLDLTHTRLRFVHGDICDADLVDELVAEADQVVHFAAESHVDRSILGADDFVTTNVLGSQRLLDAALRHGTEPFVHVSTDEVYGPVLQGSRDEESVLAPTSPYAASKASSDLVALSYHRTHGLDVRITRASNNYGPRQFPEKVIPLFVTLLLDGLSVPLYGDGRNSRDWLHVEDHCRGVDLVRTRGRPGEIYNLGGGTELTNLELTGRLLRLCGADRSAVRYTADRKGHDLRYAIDCSKAERELGYRPQRDLEEGLFETVEWYRDNRDWWEPLRARVPVTAPTATGGRIPR